ncbi:MAG: c-type cytochrome [Cyanobium sp.]
MTGPSPSAVSASAAAPSPEPEDQGGLQRFGLSRALTLLACLAIVVLLLVLLPGLRSDPYTRSTLALQGSIDNGGRLFRLNCAGCHGLAAQGLVGPNLHGVDRRKNDRQLIQQVVSGRTPPMPRFQPEPQAMADLLAFLHSLPA